MDFIRKPIDDTRVEHKEGLIEIHRLCLAFLKCYCKRDKSIQRMIFDQLDELLEIEGAEGELGECVAELFSGNEELALKVKEEQIRKLVVILGRVHIFQILKALNAIARVGFYPIKRNQNLIIKHLMLHRKETVLYVDKDDKSRAYRLDLMRQATVKLTNKGDCDPDIFIRAMYHQFLIRTIATCAEGENKYIESMCQNIFTINDLFEVLEDPLIYKDFKRPYLRFLIWVYFNTGHETVHPSLVNISHDPKIWKLIQEVTRATDEIAGGNLRTMNSVTPLNKVYIFEGAVPFFISFFDKYYQSDASLDRDIPEHVAIREKVFDGNYLVSLLLLLLLLIFSL